MKKILILIAPLILFACDDTTDQEISDVEMNNTTPVVVDSAAFFDQQVSDFPKNSDWRYKRAMFKLASGDVQQAKNDLKKAILLDSMNHEARLLYGNIFLSLTKLDSSKFHYDYILEKDSANTGALLGLSKLNALLNNSRMADLYISAALRIDPHLAEAYFMRGIIFRSDYYLTKRDKDWDVALSSFQTAVEQDPNFYSAYIEMGVMYDEKNSPLALDAYRSAIEIEPESGEAWYNLGMYHQVRDSLNLALSAYRTINQFDSTWADPYYNQGYIHLLKTKNYDSAVVYFKKATELDPTYFQAFNNLGLAYEELGDINSARKYYGRAVQANPDFQLAKDNLNRLR